MEAYNVIEMPKDYKIDNNLIKLLCEAREIYGEYKGHLKNMPFEYKYIIDAFFINEIYYSSKIDGLKNNKEDMFYFRYMNKTNDSVMFNNMEKCFLYIMSKSSSGMISSKDLDKVNKLLLTGCSKNNLTKSNGHFRTKQIYLLKPGIAGSSVSFIPSPVKNIKPSMDNLCSYFNENSDDSFISSALTHLQYEKIHPYTSCNGRMGRLLLLSQFVYSKKEAPVLFISQTIENYKNTYLTLLSDSDNTKFVKFILECIIKQCSLNIKKIKLINKMYIKDLEAFKEVIGGSTIYKIYPLMIRNVVFTTNDIVKQSGLHINSVNKVLKKLVESGYLYKEKKKGTNRITFRYDNLYNILM